MASSWVSGQSCELAVGWGGARCRLGGARLLHLNQGFSVPWCRLQATLGLRRWWRSLKTGRKEGGGQPRLGISCGGGGCQHGWDESRAKYLL